MFRILGQEFTAAELITGGIFTAFLIAGGVIFGAVIGWLVQ